LGSADPERLHAWYCAALAPEHRGGGFIRFGGTALLIDRRADVAPGNPAPGRGILNFPVGDARATPAPLTRLGVARVVAIEERTDGLFGTLVDPDGNYLQIIELNERYRAANPR